MPFVGTCAKVKLDKTNVKVSKIVFIIDSLNSIAKVKDFEIGEFQIS
jgi:hypothetical protein